MAFPSQLVQSTEASSEIDQGISRKSVEELLGKPDKVTTFANWTTLHYENHSTITIKNGVVEAYDSP